MTSALDQKGLKSCPFCGNEAELDEHQEYRNISTGALESAIAVYCATCGAQHSICRGDIPDIQPAEVIEMWNRRSTVIPAEIAGTVERLRNRGGQVLLEGGYSDPPEPDWLLLNAATLIERLAALQAETRRQALEEVEAQAEQIMLDVANEWHRQIGIDEVLKSKLVKRIADTVATGVFSKRLRALIDQPNTEGGMDG